MLNIIISKKTNRITYNINKLRKHQKSYILIFFEITNINIFDFF